jgi:hypothetical protein
MVTEIPQVVEINCETGEETYRPMTTEELAQRETDRIAWEEYETALKTEQDRVAALKVSARAKLVAGEALTEEEAAPIVL